MSTRHAFDLPPMPELRLMMAPLDLDELRELQDGAARGMLSPDERTRHAELAARLFEVVLADQNAMLKLGHRYRGVPRSRRAVAADVSWGGETHRAVTLDLGAGGFATLLARRPPRDAPVAARLQLTGRDAIACSLRVADVRERRGSCRVSFAFLDDLCDLDRARLERYLVDAALCEATVNARLHAIPRAAIARHV